MSKSISVTFSSDSIASMSSKVCMIASISSSVITAGAVNVVVAGVTVVVCTGVCSGGAVSMHPAVATAAYLSVFLSPIPL